MTARFTLPDTSQEETMKLEPNDRPAQGVRISATFDNAEYIRWSNTLKAKQSTKSQDWPSDNLAARASIALSSV
jgi:hypothetical protein